MDTKQELTIEEKLELIRSRAVRFGIKRHDLEDAVQDVIIDLLEFTPDAEKANGASESTILVTVIDRRLNKWLRAQKRYQDMVERCGTMLPSGDELAYDSSVEASDAAIDVESVLTDLPEFERQVGKMLSEGHSAYSIADELGVGRRAVNSAIDVIRERLTSAGLGGEELA
ncbi:MAG: sigma-70 family RNA polymerase sigma factor [Planctomycetaceae bacterium]|nr:sigma-70 family RNA polymerase sigma factor [Planctomycetaceae bacterium]